MLRLRQAPDTRSAGEYSRQTTRRFFKAMPPQKTSSSICTYL
jgi:hypothetical protein